MSVNDGNSNRLDYISFEDSLSSSKNKPKTKFLSKNIALYPNPTENIISVISLDEPIHGITLMDANGKTLLLKDGLTDYKHTLSLKRYDGGIYYIKVKTKMKSWIGKVVKR